VNDGTVAASDGWIIFISGTEPTDVFNSHNNYCPAHFTEYYDEMPESRNSGIGSEVDFLGYELLRQLHDNS
jgi:hypothetical protein